MKIIERSPSSRPDADASLPSVAARPARTLGAEPPAFLVCLDVLSFATAFGLAYAIAPRLKGLLLREPGVFQGWIAILSPEPGEFRPLGDVLWLLLVMAAVAVLYVQAVDGYRALVRQSRTNLVLTSLIAPLAGLGTITLILFAVRSPGWSRLFIFLFTAFSATELGVHRLVLRWYRAKRIASGFYARNILFIGSASELTRLASHVVQNTSRAEYDVVGYLSISSAQQPVNYRTDAGVVVLPCLGEVGQLSTLLVHRPVHEVIAIHGGATEWLRQVVETCDYFRITLRIVPEALIFGQLRDLQLIYHSDPLRLPEVVLRPRHLGSTALFVKRLFDVAVSAILLVLLSPLMALIAIAIKISTPRLPVFYRWNVVGHNGRRFTGYKFSSMVEDADTRRAELMPRNQMQGPVFKIHDDPRVTPLGRVLRKFSLNELPQLWSVLKGDMSLVGPRPAFPHELDRYELWHKRKLSVRPGITCLWQVRGRNQISKFDDWVRMDLEYIDNWSLWLDVRVLARTVVAVLRGSGW